MKLKIGIIFGGTSREREISFAGGRTVYDNLNKELFEPVPLFMDSFGNLVLLDWQYIYKGSIRDFYPPTDLNVSKYEYQLYVENLGITEPEKQLELLSSIGTPIEFHKLNSIVDFVFLCLHGSDGEDGRMQGMLELMRIPYSGSGIISSAIGMNKAVQKTLMRNAGFQVPDFLEIKRSAWKNDSYKQKIYDDVASQLKFPCVVKAANQGSSIGVSVVKDASFENFSKAVERSFFSRSISSKEWKLLSDEQRIDYVRVLVDIREGIGMPVKLEKEKQVFYNPDELHDWLNNYLSGIDKTAFIESLDGESEVIVESFISGKEFSCIVIENEDGNPVALPPTEIRKGKEMFDYRSKYLPGLSRKITPIELPDEQLNEIRTECERLFSALYFNVYARLDGFINDDGEIFLNDPNTTSGMLPSSFFFHQAAEIGLNPSQFLTYIIRTSIHARIADFKNDYFLSRMLKQLDDSILQQHQHEKEKIKVAVMLGGYSSERHISVESGRNIYEKLASTEKYEPLPVFVSGNNEKHFLHTIPINILLKDNADDIKEKIEHYKVHPLISEIIDECKAITTKYASTKNLEAPALISYDDLAKKVNAVFIALHGRPGEDGQVQAILDTYKIPYNGSGVNSSQLTIDKFKTTEVLMHDGMLAAKHCMAYKRDWIKDKEEFKYELKQNFAYPFIAKPVDDGCSSAVKIIRNDESFEAFCKLMFRDSDEMDAASLAVLKLKPKEEFPAKERFLVEDLISKNSSDKFLEITGGMLTHRNDKGEIEFEMFEASETLSEGDVLSLEEKFLAGQGQNITPARYHPDKKINAEISAAVKKELEHAARSLNVEGYCRIDAFVRIYKTNKVEVIFIEVNSLPGMTPATCIFHQAAINNYKPYQFIDEILKYGFERVAG